jgi:arylsulfatase
VKRFFGVKWRNWKINFKEQDSVFSETRTYGIPCVYNLHTDPQEKGSVLCPHTWVTKAGLGQLGAHVVSLRTNPINFSKDIRVYNEYSWLK